MGCRSRDLRARPGRAHGARRRGRRCSGADKIVQIGIRSVDEIEKRLVVGSGLVIYDMRRIDELRMRTVMDQALAYVAARGAHLHVSFDVDFLDPSIAPGVPSTVPGGPTYREAQLCMEMIHDSGLMRSLDIMELNPAFDEGNRTAELCVELVESLFGEEILARSAVPGRTALLSVERRDAGAELIAQTERVSAPNYAPLPVVIAAPRASGPGTSTAASTSTASARTRP